MKGKTITSRSAVVRRADAFESAKKSAGLTGREFDVLLSLLSHGESSKDTLADRIDCPVDTLRRDISELRKAALIDRVCGQENARLVRFRVSDQGMATMTTILTALS